MKIAKNNRSLKRKIVAILMIFAFGLITFFMYSKNSTRLSDTSLSVDDIPKKQSIKTIENKADLNELEIVLDKIDVENPDELDQIRTEAENF